MSRNNPFPGMNPYMEQTWGDAHLTMIIYAREALSRELPDDLRVVAEQQVDLLEMSGEVARKARPDTAIYEIPERWKGGLPPVWSPGDVSGGVLVAEPQLEIVDSETHRWLEIRTPHGELVTVIEVLSPSNKNSDRDSYRAKRRDYVAAGVNVVELDLLRCGSPTVDLHADSISSHLKRGAAYLMCVSRGIVPGRREVYPCRLRERLPAIRIPLRPDDPDVPLDVQALVDHCYTTGRYWFLDYDRPLDPPLSEADAAWSAERLKEAGLRA